MGTDRSDRKNRSYTVTSLPTLREGFDIAQNRDLLFKLYDQVCSTWKELIGVRFKLLALVPAVSIAVIATMLSTKGISEGLSQPSKLLIGLLGLLATIGLLVYDQRNSELHDDLISRGRKIEDELGIDTGIFRGRLKASGVIKHDTATNLIYGASVLAWIVGIAFVVVRL
ncbi:MAG: hypothetical protein NZ699_09760 [Roseiflexus sp.]|nr:hypothetical protein [Roseiflexus sp.]MCS7289400.1 hypothetical protein [Roseiflexus sp.]MDW8145077.1 hypothetical protein [Roseiflexaceae bacterium]MDW8233863.1 hypothetical protein [Roseiflexaceae bacterium]